MNLKIKEIPGESYQVDYKYGDALDDKQMPLIKGRNRASGKAIYANKRSFIKIRNFQFSNYLMGIQLIDSQNSEIDNVIAHTFGDVSNYSGRGIHIDGAHNKLSRLIVKNSTAVNITIYGDDNQLSHAQSYCDENEQSAATDYYITIKGNRNEVRNCYVERVGNLSHHGHGLTIRGKDNSTIVENNLYENCTVINIKGALETRRAGVKYNTFRNIKIRASDKFPEAQTGRIMIQGGASFNVFEKIDIRGTDEAIRFYGNLSESAQTTGRGNIIRNSIIADVPLIFTAVKTTNNIIKPYDNLIVNNTFVNVGTLFHLYLPLDQSNKFINNIFLM